MTRFEDQGTFQEYFIFTKKKFEFSGMFVFYCFYIIQISIDFFSQFEHSTIFHFQIDIQTMVHTLKIENQI